MGRGQRRKEKDDKGTARMEGKTDKKTIMEKEEECRLRRRKGQGDSEGRQR